MKSSTWQDGRFPFRVRSVGIGRRRVSCSIANSGEPKSRTTTCIKRISLAVKFDNCIWQVPGSNACRYTGNFIGGFAVCCKQTAIQH